MGQLVPDQRIELVRRHVDRQDHAVGDRLGEGGDELGDEAEGDVGLLELDVRPVVDEADAERDLVIEDLREARVLALGVGDDLLEMVLRLRVVVDVEVGRLVDLPVERLVGDLVLPEPEQGCRRDQRQDESGERDSERTSHEGPPARDATGRPARHIRRPAPSR